ncbi:MAG: hypothetical protein AB7U73_14685 [Pirellulales bacterium]
MSRVAREGARRPFAQRARGSACIGSTDQKLSSLTFLRSRGEERDETLTASSQREGDKTFKT